MGKRDEQQAEKRARLEKELAEHKGLSKYQRKKLEQKGIVIERKP